MHWKCQKGGQMCKQNKAKTPAGSCVKSVRAVSDRMYKYLLESLFGTNQVIPTREAVAGTVNACHKLQVKSMGSISRFLKCKIKPHTSGSTCTNGATAMLQSKSEKFPRPTMKLDLLQFCLLRCFVACKHFRLF